MNIYLFASVENIWLLTGWTMIHFVWIGTLVALAALVSRWLLRRTSANVRYATSLTFLALLAALPIIIATWLHQNPASFEGEARGGFVGIEEQIRDTTLSKTAPIDLAALEPRQNAEVPILAKTPPAIARTSEVSPAAPTRAPAASDPLALAVSTLNKSVQYLPWLWLIGTPITFALTATGLLGARRLRRASHPITDGPIVEALEKLAASLRLTRRVAVAVCDRIAAPVLIGILRPIILLPPAALTGYSPDEIEMVLLHELAHVRRWDNLVNLIQRLVESLLFFHPAVWLISSWVRREREACCDALVVTRTARPHAYAELLVALAAQMPRSVLFHPAASSAMAAGPLRSRIRRILKLDDDPMLVSGKSFLLTIASLVIAATLAALYAPMIGRADQPPTADAKASPNSAQPTTLAEALDEFRKAIVTYDLGFDSVFPQREWTAYDPDRLARYSTPDAWPNVLGHVDKKSGAFRSVREKPNSSHENASGGNAYFVPLTWNIGTENYATLLFLQGIEKNSHVVANSYTSFACFGPMAGDVLFSSYATALVRGDVSGQITANSYFDLIVTGKLSGRITAQSYAMIYIMGGFTGQLELDQSKVYIAGQTNKSDLARIKGRGKVYLEESDLPQGENSIDQLAVIVKKSTAEATDASSNAAAEVQTQNNLKNLAIALLNYNDSHKVLPPHASYDPNGKPLLSWRVLVLPHLGEEALYNQFHLNEPWDSEHNRKLIARMPAVFKNPKLNQTGKTNYLAVVGKECVFNGGPDALRIAQITDGTAQTIAIVEADQSVEWTKPQDWSFDRQHPTADLGSLWKDHWYAAFVDGSIRRFSSSKSADAVGIHFTRAGCEVRSLQESANRSVSEGAGPVPGAPGDGAGEIPVGDRRGKFPSLEDQRLADLAYKRLKLELEPVGEEDLKRVKALGYDGGLKVVAGTAGIQGTNELIQAGDMLVGLHAWPTATMKDLSQILNRNDLAELNPLKFYVVRKEMIGEKSPGGGGKASEFIMGDVVHTGRVNVTLGGDGFGGGGQFPSRSDYFYKSASQSPTPTSVERAEKTLKDAAEKRDAALKAKQEALAKNMESATANDDAQAEAVKRELEKSDRWLEQAKREFEKAKHELDRAKEQQNPTGKSEPQSTNPPAAPKSQIPGAPSTSPTVNTQPVQPATPSPGAKVATPVGITIIPNTDRVKTSDGHVASIAIDPTSAASAGGNSQVTLTPAESVFVAYDIPPDLKNKALQYFAKSDVRIMADDRGRYIVQASQAWHDNFAALLKATPKWRDPAAAKERAAKPVAMKKVDDEDILEWRSVGLSLQPGTYFVRTARGGVAVAEVAPGSPAAWADIRPGDVLDAVGSFNAGTMPELQSLLKALGEGLQTKKEVRVKFFRQITASVVIADFTLGPEDLGAKPAGPQTPNSPAGMQSSPAPVDKANISYDGKNFAQWRALWDQADADPNRKLRALYALQAFADAGLQREANGAIMYGLYSDSLLVAQRTRQYLKALSKSDAAPIVDALLFALKSDLSPDRRISALRGLAAIGPNAESALPELEKSLAKKNPRERIAAATAIKKIVGKDQYQKPVADVLGEELGIKVERTPDGKWGALPRDDSANADAFNKFTEDVIKEQELLFPPDDNKPPK